jgi:hypothetical protein
MEYSYIILYCTEYVQYSTVLTQYSSTVLHVLVEYSSTQYGVLSTPVHTEHRTLNDEEGDLKSQDRE